MKTIHNTKIIGIDHGYGNMKTASCCFPTGITAYDHEPLFTADMLVYGGQVLSHRRGAQGICTRQDQG